MKITKIVIAVALFVFCFSYMGSPVMAQDSSKVTKGVKPGSSVNAVSHQGTSGFNNLKNDEHVYSALEELKVLSNEVTKKTNVNRNLILGSAVTNLLLLIVLSGLMGYSNIKNNSSSGGSSGSSSGSNSGSPGE